ncbi:hypothetical protein L289_0818 [Acinetobacter gerneri DSM 14967 = CIP 107464 = MTCC 9824]|nr:hypothetical protein L289_0818 [Acinetobacter gerneri DSM 14967 = CIP 107464 = MTCC 9824]
MKNTNKHEIMQQAEIAKAKADAADEHTADEERLIEAWP